MGPRAEVTTEEMPLQPLSREALTVRRIRVAIETAATLILIVAALVVARRLFDFAAPAWLIVLGVLVISGIAWWWAGVDHARWRWRLSKDLFEVRHGVLVHRSYMVPRSRIQNVTTKAGPLQRRFGLITLTVHTAGARTRSVSVEDIGVDKASAIRRRLDLV